MRLTNRIGLDPTAIGSSLIPRAVRMRMNELGLVDVDSYTSLPAAAPRSNSRP